MSETKKCTKCGIEKTEEKFGWSWYYARVCLECQKKYNLCGDCGMDMDIPGISCGSAHVGRTRFTEVIVKGGPATGISISGEVIKQALIQDKLVKGDSVTKIGLKLAHNHRPVVDKLQAIMDIQKEFQTKYKFDLPVHNWASAIMSEGGELWLESGGKWWKRYLGPGEGVWAHYDPDLALDFIKNVEILKRDSIIEETIDILHFLVGAWLQLGLTADQVFEAYTKKMGTNKSRQETGY